MTGFGKPVGAGIVGKDAPWDSVFAGLPEQDLARVMALMTRRRVPPRKLIFSMGDPVGDILIIESGRVRTVFTTEDALEYTTGVWSAGYPIGLISAIQGSRRVLSAEAIDEVSLLSLPVTHLETAIAQSPAFARRLMGALAFMASSGISHATQIATRPVHVRVAEALLALAALPETIRSGHSAEIVGISQEELARLVSASRPWVTRALSDFAEQGLVVCYRLRIVVPDCRRLRLVR